MKTSIIGKSGKEIMGKIPAVILAEKLKASEVRYRRLFESAKDGILILNWETGKIIDVNPFLVNLLGFSKDEFVEKEIWEIGFFKDVAANKEKFSELQKQEYVRYENLPLETSDGRKINVEFVSNVYLEDYQKIIQCNIRDITDRKRKEEAFINAEILRHILLQTIPDLIWSKDKDGIYLSCNKMFERFFGTSETEILGKTDYDFVDRDLADFFRENDRKAMEAGKPIINEEWITFPDDGHRVYLETIKAPMYDAKNGLIGVLGIGRDITAHVNSEKEITILVHSLKSVKECVSITDLDDKILFANESFLKTYGYGLNELIGENIKIIQSQNNDQKLLNEILPATIKGEWLGELMNRRKDGSEFPIHLSTSVIKDKEDKVLGLIGVATDITSKKHAEELLRESEERLRLTLEETQIGTFDWDIIKDEYKVSNTYYTMLGYKPKEGFADRNEWLYRVHPDDRDMVYKKIQSVINGLELNYQYEARLMNSIGQYRWIYVIGHIVKWDENNKPVRLIGVRIDITERKVAEEELIKAKEKAEESDRLKSAFLSNMSHEIRTPMNGILGFTELLKEPLLTGEQQKEYIGIIEKSGTRMLNIINDIISISKIESGEIKISASITKINELVENLISFFSHEAEQKNIKIEFLRYLPADEAYIKTDKEKVTSILTNLIKNAIKFTETGSIEVGYIQKGDYLQFFVKDSGTGVPDELKEIIFERFRQGSDSLIRNYEGAGLGLSISKGYVDVLGGKIWVESNPKGPLTGKLNREKGSTFYFTIPYYPEELENNTMENSFQANQKLNLNKDLKTMIVEDDVLSELLISIITRSISPDILRVGTGPAAVETCRNNPDIDLILMDIKMPEMDGYEATRKIREFNKDVIIIAQTAYGLEGDREKAIEAGCNDYIPKPINQIKLKEMVEKHLNIHKTLIIEDHR